MIGNDIYIYIYIHMDNCIYMCIYIYIYYIVFLCVMFICGSAFFWMQRPKEAASGWLNKQTLNTVTLKDDVDVCLHAAPFYVKVYRLPQGLVKLLAKPHVFPQTHGYGSPDPPLQYLQFGNPIFRDIWAAGIKMWHLKTWISFYTCMESTWNILNHMTRSEWFWMGLFPRMFSQFLLQFPVPGSYTKVIPWPPRRCSSCDLRCSLCHQRERTAAFGSRPLHWSPRISAYLTQKPTGSAWICVPGCWMLVSTWMKLQQFWEILDSRCDSIKESPLNITKPPCHTLVTLEILENSHAPTSAEQCPTLPNTCYPQTGWWILVVVILLDRVPTLDCHYPPDHLRNRASEPMV